MIIPPMEVELMVDIQEIFNKLQGKIEDWISGFILMLPNFVVAILVMLLFILAAKFIRSGSLHLLDKISINKAINRLVVNVIYIVVILIGLFFSLSILQLDKTVTSLLAGAGIIGLALSFAFQETFMNFIAGVIIATRKPFLIGDLIETNDHFGTVTEINLRTIVIITIEGQWVNIPNKLVLENPIINFSKLGRRRVVLGVGISYGEDLEKVRKVVLNALEKIDYISHSDGIDFYYTEFGDSSINFITRFWIDYQIQKDFLKSKSDAIMAIKKAFDENDITIPFPIRTLDFGIKGGEKLNELWPVESRKEK